MIHETHLLLCGTQAHSLIMVLSIIFPYSWPLLAAFQSLDSKSLITTSTCVCMAHSQEGAFAHACVFSKSKRKSNTTFWEFTWIFFFSFQAAQLYFRGQQIWLAAIDELMSKGMKNADQVFVTFSNCFQPFSASVNSSSDFRRLFFLDALPVV